MSEKDGLLNFSESDISLELAIRAHRGTSFSSEKRGASVVAGYVSDMQTAVDEFSKYVNDENRADIAADLEAYRTGYIKRLNAYLHAHSNVISVMIAGPSNFPVERNRKRGETADKRRDEWVSWCNWKLDKMRDLYNPRRLANAPIRADDNDAIAKLQDKIAKAEEQQELMKAINKVVKSKRLDEAAKRQKLVEMGVGDRLIGECLTPDYAGQYGIPPYMLSNNNANIRRMKERLIVLEREEARAQEGTAVDKEIVPGVTLSENTDITRLQLFFPDKPPQAVRDLLKSNGFNFSYREGAWQRLLNDNARAAVRRMTPKLAELMGHEQSEI
jgi:hypothetical protein